MECPECSGENPSGARFCNACGAALGDTSAPVATAPEGQRRQVTALFADMAGYTPLAERLGEEDIYRLMQPVWAHMIDTVTDFEGTVQDIAGDGIMALFGAPVAIEDAPLWACRAALSLQQRMGELSLRLEAEHGVRPQLRIGINTGPVVVGKVGTDKRMELKAVGDTVNLAARLQGEADIGGIMISETTHRLVEGFVEASFAGERMLKGKSAPQRLWRLEGVKAGVRRFDVAIDRGLTKLVGRDAELDSLQGAWERAKAGAVRVVDIVGDAGIGKSRLIYEFWRRLEGESLVTLRGHCSADGVNTAFLPFIELIRDWFHIAESDTAEEVSRKLASGIEILSLDSAATLPYLLNLLGQKVDGREFTKEHAEVAGIRTREALQNMLTERCATAPVVLFIDDLHWMDTASESLLLWATAPDRHMPLLVLCAYRPQYRAPWADAANSTELRLPPLTRGDTLSLLEHHLGGRDLPPEIARLAVEKADGNPLFAEEMVSYLISKGELAEGTDGAALGLPETLENLLMDRVDRLDQRTRAVLQAASVVGRRFSRDLVTRVIDASDGIDEQLGALERQRLIFKDPDDPAEYGFMHALVQDAIYDTLLKPQRQALHERVAEAIEGAHPDGELEVSELLAHHYSRTPRAEKAVRYMALAAAKALSVYSLDAAEFRIRQVIELIEAKPQCADDTFLADVLLSAGRIYYYRADFKGLIVLLDKYLPRVEALGDQRRLARFLFETGYAHVFSGDHAEGRALLGRALAIGEEIEDDQAIGYPCMGLIWYAIYWSDDDGGRRETIARLAERALAAGGRLGDTWLLSKVLVGQLVAALVYGRPGEARRHGLKLLELSRESGDPRPRVMGLWGMALSQAYHFEESQALDAAEEALRVSLSRIDRMGANAARGTALAGLGRIDEAIALLEAARKAAAEGGFVSFLPPIIAILGASKVMSGAMGAGVAMIERMIREFEAMGNRGSGLLGNMVLGEIYLEVALGEEKPPLKVLLRNLGFVLRTVPFAKAKARRHLSLALAEARRMDAPSFTARILYDLGRLSRAQKRMPEANAAFAEARALAETAEAPALLAKIDAALTS